MQYQDTKIFEGPVNNLLSKLQTCSGIVDLQPAFFQFTLATMVSLIFGEPFPGLSQVDHDNFAEALTTHH